MWTPQVGTVAQRLLLYDNATDDVILVSYQAVNRYHKTCSTIFNL